jgi:hypothetical protein
MKIQHLLHHQIDKNRWNSAILNSRVPLVYALFDYLEIMCDGHWSALVYGDYEAVFPLPHKTKFGITYIVQPVFCQQLGAFGSNQNVSTQDFLNAIPKRFLRVRLQLNPYFDGQSSIAQKQKTNLLLDLSDAPNYNKDCRKNLASLAKLPITYSSHSISIDETIGVYQHAWGEANRRLSKSDYQKFSNACKRIQQHHQATLTIAAHRTDTKELLGAAILVGFPTLEQHQERHLHYVCAGPTETGKSLGIMHGIIDFTIQNHLGEGCFFDFEGSSIPSVAAFYQKFGAQNRPFYLFQRGL